MSWTKLEAKKINGICSDLKEVKDALVGSLDGKPGLQDRVRDLRKYYKYLFILSGITLFGLIWHVGGGGVESLVKFIVKAL